MDSLLMRRRLMMSQSSLNHDYSKDYLTLTILTGGTIGYVSNSVALTNLYYSINDGAWQTDGKDLNIRTLSQGDTIKFYRYPVGPHRGSFGGSALFDVSGNIMSMQDGQHFENSTSVGAHQSVFSRMFASCGVVNAENLIIPVIDPTVSCYESMFEGCTSLITAPELQPRINDYVFKAMFKGCTSLTTTPVLKMQYIIGQTTWGACAEMFYGCSSLNRVEIWASDYWPVTDHEDNLEDWLYGVSANGTFIKNETENWSTTYGSTIIPSGWTVVSKHIDFSI